MYILWFLLIGLIAGWLANLIMKGTGSGLVVNLIIGIIGSVLGGWIFGLLGIVTAGTIGSIVTAIIGAIVLLAIVSLFTKKK